jgi:hypothetical protein
VIFGLDMTGEVTVKEINRKKTQRIDLERIGSLFSWDAIQRFSTSVRRRAHPEHQNILEPYANKADNKQNRPHYRGLNLTG